MSTLKIKLFTTAILFLMGVYGVAHAADPEKPTLHLFTDSQIPVDIKLNSGQFMSRYRIVDNRNGVRTTDQLENRMMMDVTVSFFKDGRVKLNFMGSTGKTFIGSYSPADVGPTGTDQFQFNIRRFSITYSPFLGTNLAIEDLALSAGSMAPEDGSGSENTYFDNDGYVMGYRAKVSIDKKQGYLVVTGGYVGDLSTPNVFDRLNRIGEFNYLQALINHSIGAIAVGSLDYTYWEKNHYVRGALNFNLSKWTRFLDSLVIEDLARVSSGTSKKDYENILAVTLAKRFKALLPGDRDVALAVTYLHNGRGMNFPISDSSFLGRQIKVSVTCPNLASLNAGGKLGLFLQYIQDLEDTDQIRADFGISMIF